MSNKVSRSSGNAFPQKYSPQLVQKRKFRYQVNTGDISADVITIGCLRSLLVAKSDTANSTAALLLFQAIRLCKVEMWGVQSTGGNTFTTVSLIWKGINAPFSEFSNTGNNVKPAHIACTPPANSQCGWWQDFSATQTTVLFELSAPLGAIVEVTIEYVLHDGSNGDACTLGAATTAIGVFAPALDSLSTSNTAGTSYLKPVGLEYTSLASI